MLIPLSEHELLVFWVQLAALIGVARLLGWLMKRIGMPSVVGELSAGLVLGPSVFGELWPQGFEWFLPDEAVQSGALLAVSWLGVAFLLVVTGFETDLNLIAKLGRPAALVTTGSLVLPLAGGLVLGAILPDSFLPQDGRRFVFVLFVAAALSVSSLAVVAKILGDLGLMRRDFGQITVAAGMANDVVGWLMLGVFSGIAVSGSFNVGETALTIGGLLAFIFLALTLGQRLVDGWLRRMRRSQDSLGGSITVLVVVMLLFAVITQRLEVEAVLGAFVAGVMLNRSRYLHHETLERIESLTMAFFAPLFFATAGLRVDLAALGEGDALAWTGVIVAAAVVLKFVGSYWGARVAGRTRRGGFALGAGLNARGALEIVIATVGLSLGVFNDVSYTAIVLVPIVTSLLASLGLRAVVYNWRGDPGEVSRLDREEALSKNLVVTTSRLLIPSRGGPGSVAAAQVLHFAWPPEAGVTILTVDPVPGKGITRYLKAGLRSAPSRAAADLANQNLSEADVTPLENVFHERDVEHRQIKRSDVVDAIISESQLGFGAIGIGMSSVGAGAGPGAGAGAGVGDAADAADGSTSGPANPGLDLSTDTVLSPLAEELLSVSPLPVIVVRRPSAGVPAAFGRALVPVSAAPASRMACEVAFNISAQLGTQVMLAHVVEPDDSKMTFPGFFGGRRTAGGRRTSEERDLQRGQLILQKTEELARDIGVAPETTIVHNSSRSAAILELEAQTESDLIVMGAQLRRVNNRPYLGPTAEQILRTSAATVVLVLMPFDL